MDGKRRGPAPGYRRLHQAGTPPLQPGVIPRRIGFGVGPVLHAWLQQQPCIAALCREIIEAGDGDMGPVPEPIIIGTTIRVTPEQAAKLQALGGRAWLRRQLYRRFLQSVGSQL